MFHLSSTAHGIYYFPAASLDPQCLVQGLERLAEYDYVAIFDADFKPDADFLVSDPTFACTHKRQAHALIQCYRRHQICFDV